MPKPWAKYEVGFVNHPKFRVLNANAICLWLEGKDYCDANLTDGLIPAHEAKRFRFGGMKSINLLTASAGPKNAAGDLWAPLWEKHPIGYRMHDYLDHNDCREAHMARLEDAEDIAELRKVANRERQAKFRAERKQKLLRHGGGHATSNAQNGVTSHPISEAETESDPQEPVLEGGARSAPPRLAPLHDRSHRNHAHCGRICLHASLFGEFVRRRNHAGADKEIRDFCMDVERAWSDGGVHASDEPGEPFDFWKARYAERWPSTLVKSVGARPQPSTSCRYGHQPPCLSSSECTAKFLAEAREQVN